MKPASKGRFGKNIAIGIAIALSAGAVVGSEEKPKTIQNTVQSSVLDASMAMEDGAGRAQEETIARRLHALIDTATKGLPASLKGRTWKTIDAHQAALRAIEKNLSILQGKISERVADAVLEEAQAVFDPVIRLTVSGSGQEAYDRSTHDQEYSKEVPASACDAQGTNCVDPQPVSSHSLIGTQLGLAYPIASLTLNQARPAGYYTKKIQASTASAYAGGGGYQLRLDQELSWGGSFEIAQQTTVQQTFFEFQGVQLPYKLPWVSNLSASFSTPVPFTKGFGDLNSDNVNRHLAALSDRYTYWQVQTTLNSTLSQVDLAYWELVRSLRYLVSYLDNAEQIDKLSAITHRLLDLKTVTVYEQSRVDAQQAQVQASLEQAWASFVSAGASLKALIGMDGADLLLPTGYSGQLKLKEDPSWMTIVEEARLSSPSVQAQEVAVEMAELVQRQRHNGLRPDLRVSASVTLAQSNQIFGYGGYPDSLRNLASPDAITQSYGLYYTYPVGNRAAKANLDAANHALAGSTAQREQAQLSVAQNINDSIAGLLANRERLAVTKKAAELSRVAYGKAKDRQQARTVTEYEIVSKSQAVLQAELAQVDAEISYRESWAQLLAAAGLLPRRYGEVTAETPLDRQRVQRLAAAGVLGMFANNGGTQR